MTYDNDNDDGFGAVRAMVLAAPLACLIWLVVWWLLAWWLA